MSRVCVVVRSSSFVVVVVIVSCIESNLRLVLSHQVVLFASFRKLPSSDVPGVIVVRGGVSWSSRSYLSLLHSLAVLIVYDF